MNDPWSRFVVFLLGDPEVLEGRKGSEDGTTDPNRVFALGGCDDLDLYGGRK